MPKLTPLLYSNEESIHVKVRTLSLILNSNCNLNCAYCYEKEKNASGTAINIEVAKDAITYYMELDDDFDHVLIDIFGGEPLISFSLFRDIFHWCQSKKWRKHYHFVIGTNGTLLNNEMKSWFSIHRNDITLGFSIDGNRTAHNLGRDNSYDLLYPHIEFFKENWPNQPAKMTICGDTIPYLADSVIELEKMGLYFTANIIFEDFWGYESNKKKLLNILEEQLQRLVEFYIENSNLYPVYPLLGYFPTQLGIPGFNKIMESERDCVRFCGAGHEIVVVDTDGKRYPCHRFLPWATGKDAPKEPINRQSSWKPEICEKCKIVDYCPTCAGFNWEINNDTGIRTIFHCEAHKLEVLAAAKIAAERIQKLPVSYLESLKPEDRSLLTQKINTIFELLENGI